MIPNDLIDLPIETDRVDWEARQVVRDLYGEPHLLDRLTLTGTRFEHRALEPYVAVGDVRSRFVEISEDGLRADAYFDEPIPGDGTIEFGYGDEPVLRIRRRFDREDVRRLDPERLPEKTRLVGRFFDRDE